MLQDVTVSIVISCPARLLILYHLEGQTDTTVTQIGEASQAMHFQRYVSSRNSLIQIALLLPVSAGKSNTNDIRTSYVSPLLKPRIFWAF